MKKRFGFLILMMISVTACSTSGNGAGAGNSTPSSQSTSEAVQTADMPKYLTIGSSAVGGAYYPVALAFGEVAKSQLGVETTAQNTGGAEENITLIQEGTIDFGITQSGMAYRAVNGTGGYDTVDNMAGIINNITTGTFQVVTLKSTGIENLEDLKGRNVCLGPAGGGSISVAKDVFEELGFTFDDMNPTYTSYSDGISNLTDGKVDAVVIQAALPTATIQELFVTKPDQAVILDVETDTMKALLEKYPYYGSAEISADMYGMANSVQTIGMSNLLIGRKDLPEEVVYNFTKAMVENLDAVHEAAPATKNLSAENAAANMPIELHPGARKYYEEAGLLK